ncbi:hypothetical protein BU26DRAFT_207357 [Trematosphaeria pertusa]|uniref:Uncharacterized protein n=1 Tax=Trematosphaeria pertusa TaxID=390896 RepID=A0A6A6HRT5_9PLEO|nr:uncharacterized protein BU26DRAFT_207357 [Trematosphaeria pertusa]KAF2240532.1 hypothetical protein BU26DRAFT_207357 [Trematosphaeria pertusa]
MAGAFPIITLRMLRAGSHTDQAGILLVSNIERSWACSIKQFLPSPDPTGSSSMCKAQLAPVMIYSKVRLLDGIMKGVLMQRYRSSAFPAGSWLSCFALAPCLFRLSAWCLGGVGKDPMISRFGRYSRDGVLQGCDRQSAYGHSFPALARAFRHNVCRCGLHASGKPPPTFGTRSILV